jgi:O-antigen ligase
LNTRFLQKAQDRLLVVGCFGMAATVYFPIGFAWFFFLVTFLSSLFRAPGYFRQPMTWLCLALLGWMLLTSYIADSNFDPTKSRFILYGLLLMLPLFGLRIPKDLAARTIRVFLVASVLAGLIILTDKIFHLPDAQIWRQLIGYTGNKSISNLILLTIGATMLLVCALAESGQIKTGDRAHQFYPLYAAFLAWIVLWTAQSRTALLLLPIVLIAVLLREQFELKTKVIVSLSALLLTSAIILSSPTAAGRIQQAFVGYNATEFTEVKSNSMIVRNEMNKLSVEMFKASPHIGNGIGSWEKQWHVRRQVSGAHSSVTPHNEYLSIASQTGWPGLLLFIGILTSILLWTWRGSYPWHSCGLIISCAWFWASFFNVTIRDTQFSLPLLFLTGVAMAANRDNSLTTH